MNIPLPTSWDEAEFLIGGGLLSLYASLTMRQKRMADPQGKLPVVLYVILVLGIFTVLCGIYLVIT